MGGALLTATAARKGREVRNPLEQERRCLGERALALSANISDPLLI